MKKHCVNHKNKDVVDLANSLGIHPAIAASKIAIWQEKNGLDKFPTNSDLVKQQEINYNLKATNILLSDKAKQVFDKGAKNGWDLNKILTELQVPKEQKQLILDMYNNMTVYEDKVLSLREQLALELASNYSYTVEINTTKTKVIKQFGGANFNFNNYQFLKQDNEEIYFKIDNVNGGNAIKITKEEYEENKKAFEDENNNINSEHYSNLTVPGGTNYTENEISTPAITPSIKGHAQFATDNGIGWFRSDEKPKYTHFEAYNGGNEFEYEGNKYEEVEDLHMMALPTYTKNGKEISEKEYNEVFNKAKDAKTTDYKTRRILEVQSDLFQKGRDKTQLTGREEADERKREAFEEQAREENWTKEKWDSVMSALPINEKGNQFLQLLNKDSNWVTFFIKSIIQDSAKKGYEKVLFPSGNTASKVEGHTTLEEFKKQKEDRIKELESQKKKYSAAPKDDPTFILDSFNTKEEMYNKILGNTGEISKDDYIFYDTDRYHDKEIDQLKQELERVETEGFGALKPIYNFYENTVTNILKKQGYTPVEITDEYGNTWNEIELTSENTSEILLIKKDLNDLLDKNNKEELFNVTDTSDDKVIISNKLDSVVDNSAVNKVLFFNDAEIPSEMLVNDLIFNLLNTTEFILSPETKILFQKLLNLFDKSGAKVKIVSREEFLKLDEKGKLDNALMIYDNAVNTIYMYEEAFTLFQPYTLLHGFIHEVAHSTTYEWYKRPRTQAQRDFKKFIDDNFQHYRQLALELNPNENELSYGFTNEVEFIAELYSNLKFQKEIQNIDEVNKVKKPFLQQLMEWFRQLLNRPLTKETVEFYNNLILIDTINKEVEMDKRGFKGSYQNNFTTNDFSFITKPKEEKHEYPKLDSIDKKLDYTLDQIKDNIQINLGKYDKIKKKLKGERKEKVEAYIDSLKELLASLNKYSEADRWKAIISYTKALSKNINTLQHRFSVEDFADKDVVGVINLYSNYLNSYSLIKEIVKLTSDLKSEKQTLVTEDELEEITSSLTYASGLYNTLSSDFKSVLRKALKERLSNVKYVSEIETIWKKKLEKEYKDLKLTEPKEPWIAKQMNGVYKDEIQKDVELYVNNLIDSPAFDITSATAFFNSSINTNSKLITIFQTMLDEIRNNIIERTREKDFKLSSLFEKLVKEKGSSDVVTLYKNIIEYDGDMPILKGEYSIKYKIDKQKALDHFNEVKKTNESNSSIYQAAKTAVNKIQFKNYKNDFSKLSATEREVLEEFQSIINDSHKATFGISSLKKYYKGVNYLSLPSITKSDLERVVSGDVKGTIKDKVTDLTKIKTDDIGFDYAEKNIDLAGNPIYNIRVLYRGQIDGKNQSLDLFTMMRLEFINGVNYDEKHQKEMELAAIVEIAKDKDYYRTEGIRLPIINKYANRNKLSTKEGIDSNTYKRLLSLMESNIYNISHKYSGKLGPVDINKAIKVTNGLTAQISLALNPFSATANVINGKAQMFLEGISKNVIDFKNLKRAETIYSGDFGNNMRDLGTPIKKSFTNQVNIMFDSFGTISIGNQAFIKNNLAKTIADPHQLQFMHEGGEHWMQSTLTMAVLDSVKVMNENNDFINKEGNIVDSKEKAASLIDMLSLNSKTGKLEMSDKVIYTTHTLTTKYHEGGKEHINSLVKKKILDTMGNYDSNMQPEAMRHWWGKLFLMFRRYLIPMGIARFRGFAYSFKSNEELQQDPDKYLSYSHSLKDYEEGMYTSLVRYMKHGIYPAIKQLQFGLTQDYWDTLSDSQKGNIKKAITEMTLTAVLLPLLGFILGSMVGGSGDDDDKYLYFIMYQARRLESDLSQYRNLSENFKLIRSPIPSVRILETASTVLFKTIQPWTWDDEFKSGKRKGDLKYVRDWEKLIPVLNKLDVTAEDLYKFQDSKFGMN